MTKTELKKLVKECLLEIVTETAIKSLVSDITNVLKENLEVSFNPVNIGQKEKKRSITESKGSIFPGFPKDVFKKGGNGSGSVGKLTPEQIVEQKVRNPDAMEEDALAMAQGEQLDIETQLPTFKK